MICHACGTKSGDTDKFCPECGKSLVSDSVASEQQAAHAQNTEVSREPDTLKALIGLLLQNSAKSLKRNLKTLILAVIVAFVAVYGLQLVLAANLPGGEAVASSPLPLFLSQLQGATVSTGIIWFLLPVFGGAIYAQIRSLGLEGYLRQLSGLAGSVGHAAKRLGSRGIGLMLACMALTVSITALTGNIKVIEAALAVLAFNAVLAGAKSLLVLGLQLAHRDWIGKKVTAPLVTTDFPLLAVAGVSLGFVVSLFLTDTTMFFLSILILGIIGVMFFFIGSRSVRGKDV